MRQVGDPIYDENGMLVCRLAREPMSGTTPRPEDFTDWQPPYEPPNPGDEMIEAVLRYVRGNPFPPPEGKL